MEIGGVFSWRLNTWEGDNKLGLRKFNLHIATLFTQSSRQMEVVVARSHSRQQALVSTIRLRMCDRPECELLFVSLHWASLSRRQETPNYLRLARTEGSIPPHI